MTHAAIVDTERTTLAQMRVAFAWCTCGKPLELVPNRRGTVTYWRHFIQRRHAA